MRTGGMLPAGCMPRWPAACLLIASLIACEQVGCRLHTLDRSNCPLFDGPAPLDAAVDARAEATFNAMMDQASEQRSVRKGTRTMHADCGSLRLIAFVAPGLGAALGAKGYANDACGPDE